MDFQGSYSSLTFDSDDESIEFDVGAEDSLEGSFSLGLEEEEDEEDENGFNRWYLQRDGMEFATPILFEDGIRDSP